MTKKVSLVFVSVLALIVQGTAVSVVNNVTLPSDILTTLLFDEIQNNRNLTESLESIQSTGSYNSEKCIWSLQKIVNQFPSLSVLPFIDSWGKIPSGLLYGHLKELGNFDQCVRTSVKLNIETDEVNGQYCFATIPVTLNVGTKPVQNRIRFDSPIIERELPDLNQIAIAICIPDVCDPILVTKIFEKATDGILQGALSGIQIEQCMTIKKPAYTAITIVGIVIFSMFAGMMILSTAYDAYTQHFKKPVKPLFLAFSVLTNGRKLFEINTRKSPNSIDCLTGIRVLSMAWVMLFHNYVISLIVGNINVVDVISWYYSPSALHYIAGRMSVDTFLFISGLLVAWIGMRDLEKSNGKLNVPMMYFHRYIRLTPPVAAVILFYVSLNEYVGSGPYRPPFIAIADRCKTNWWSALLYIQNYVNPDNVCIVQSWYLSVDTQLYFLSPLVLIPLWKWGKKFSPVLVLLSLLSIGCVIATFFKEGYNDIAEDIGSQNARIYMPTHTRYTVWLIGLGFGYFMYKNKNVTICPPKWIQLLGWVVCFGTILAIIYGPYATHQPDHVTTVLENAIYEALKRVSWAIALTWLVFACHFGFGGLINSFLSHPWWQPLGRLTYSMYLVHVGIELINFGIIRTDMFFSDYNEVLHFWNTFGLALSVGIIWTLAFESPVLVIEKALLGGSKSLKPKTTN